MSNNLIFTIRFLQPYCHGRGDGGKPEWPPSPLRLVQALVAASAARWNERIKLEYAKPALQWLASLPQPVIIAAKGIPCENPYRLYVPDNLGDKVAKAWLGNGSASVANYRTDKDVCPTHILGDAVHYLYTLSDGICPHLEDLKSAARNITHLGWGIDMVAADADMISDEAIAKLPGHRWRVVSSSGMLLRVPKQGTLDDLMRKHADCLDRVSNDGFRPVPPLSEFNVVRYRPQYAPLRRPFRLFELRNLDGSRFRYQHSRLIHIAGMVRHLAIEAMRKDPPLDIENDWIESYVAGHRKTANAGSPENVGAGEGHRQLSYLPLPSIGHEYADPGIRRVMITAPLGDDALLDHVARRLAGQMLKPVQGDEFGCDQEGRPNDPPLLVPMRRSGDGVTSRYTTASSVWHSFTPVILPGHDDHKPDKTRALIERALAQSGIDQPCTFEWSAFSRFPKAYSAHKYDKRGPNDGRIGYIRPSYLLSQTGVHLTLHFHDGTKEQLPITVPGPLALGAGRNCGFGLMATVG